uniref:Probable protein Rev n=1 Tax=Feline immunodeficiency virus (isolate Petaluma) TaxID=11674 RepID=REV_FIVPE|nr:RecName: Full=Probable protein Rev; AltName: Full=3'ORF; AltName: Full=ART/TRS; AltName: Full=Anti-repression transactivator; AltName: Full=ORF4; AltName: Full=ORFH; AltName: Full=Regulator of expression of viral proteins [Feline immunodeficiency virus (isolate Petaluma)]
MAEGFAANRQWIGLEEAEELLDFDIATQMSEEGPLNPGVNPFRVPGITEKEKQNYCNILQPKLQDLRNEIQEVKLEEGNAGKRKRQRRRRKKKAFKRMMTELEDRFRKLFGTTSTTGDSTVDSEDEPPKKEKRVDWDEYWNPEEIERMLMD